jgi:hypothetical protein
MGCISSTPKPTTPTTTTTAPTAESTNRQRRAQTPVYDPPAYIDCGKSGYNRGSGGVYNGASGSTYDRSRESGTVSYAGSESGKRVDGGEA